MNRLLILGYVLSSLATPALAKDESPEVKALISKFKDDAKSKTSATRASAYKAIGELGSEGKNVRRSVSEGMLDPTAKVRIAAADALKKIDENIYNLATAIVINKDVYKIQEVRAMADEGEPLTSLILNYASTVAPTASLLAIGPRNFEARRDMTICIETLTAIAPDDLEVNKAVVNMLKNPNPEMRSLAVNNVKLIKNRKLALSNLLWIAQSTDAAAVRVKAITLVIEVMDENTSPPALKIIEGLRFDREVTVREVVEKVLQDHKP